MENERRVRWSSLNETGGLTIFQGREIRANIWGFKVIKSLQERERRHELSLVYSFTFSNRQDLHFKELPMFNACFSTN